jgi:hypothetical protein
MSNNFKFPKLQAEDLNRNAFVHETKYFHLVSIN